VNLRAETSTWEGWNYLAPEIRQYYPLISGLDLRKNDIYALAMIVVENLLGERYFPREGRALRLHIQKHIHGYSPSLMRTLMRMLSLDPAKRPETE
jgi:serine/threonine protein kinase